MRVWIRLLALTTIATATALACSDKTPNADFGPDATTPENDGGSGIEGGNLDKDAADGSLVHEVRVTGRALAPEGTIPIANAVVYLTATRPLNLSTGKHCDICVPLPSGTPYALTGTDGTFSIKATSGEQYVVVQKGAFRRIRMIKVPSTVDTFKVPEEYTTLPGSTGEGDTIPKMAVVSGIYDHIESTLAKLGLGEVDELGNYLDGTGSFDLYEDRTGGDMTPDTLLKDPAKLAEYQIIFRPCTTCDDTHPSDPTVMTNLKNFVMEGGKLYVTDYLYEYVHQGWPDYVSYHGADTYNGGCMPAYTVSEQVTDPDLGGWLGALGVDISAFTTVNGSRIDSVNEGRGPKLDGGIGPITPKVWIQETVDGGGLNPNTISFDHGCGRVLYATYDTQHTVAKDLSPQELALFYVLLEVNVCVGPPIPPPPAN